MVDRLKGKAIEPQAVVTVTRNVSNTVSVTGEVSNGACIPLTVRGDRVLDVIAAAGGLHVPANEAFIRLTRGGRTASVPFNALQAHPTENIYMRGGDVLTIVRKPQIFTAFGATGINTIVPFGADSLTLEEAVAKAGGLLDHRADPRGVFLFRYEPVDLVEQITSGPGPVFDRIEDSSPDTAKDPSLDAGKEPSSVSFKNTSLAALKNASSPERLKDLSLEMSKDDSSPVVPVIYRLNFRDAASYFLARKFDVRDKDLIYVASAPATELQKFLGLIGTTMSPATSAAATAVTLH